MEIENAKEEKTFRYIIIPMFILEDATLQAGEKLLFGMIASNTLLKGYCWLSNQYIAKQFNVTTRTVTRWISHFVTKSYITTELLHRSDSKEIEERRIRINTSIPILADYMQWYGHPCLEGVDTVVHTPLDTGVQDNNKGINNNFLSNDVSNIKLNSNEYQSLLNEFGLQKLEVSIFEYSKWKQQVGAHPKSDFDSLHKWLTKAQHPKSKKGSSVRESGADEVTDDMLKDLPF